MNSNQFFCKLCFNNITEPSILISNQIDGKSHLQVGDLIRLHFPFYEKILYETINEYICTICYGHLNEFHALYESVANNYGMLNVQSSKDDISTYGSSEKQDIGMVPLIKLEQDENEVEQKHEEVDMHWMIEYERDIFLPATAEATRRRSRSSSSSSRSDSSSSEDVTPSKKKYHTKKKKNYEYSISDTIDDQRIRDTAIMNCEHCMEALSNFRDAKIHYKEEHGVSGYIICCGKKFKQKCRLVDHINKHYDLSYECNICQKSFDSKSYLMKHMACHEVEKQFKCDHCPKTFAKKFQVRNHLMSVHIYDNKEPEFLCPLDGCGKKFVNQARLKHHIDYTHASENSEICDICSKTFKTKHAVEEHRQIHFKRPEDRIKCEICGHYLSNMKTYKRHRKNHDTESMENTCNYCGKVSPNLNALKKHIHYVHERVASFHCRYCSKSFKRARNLIDHEASVHTLQELYTCSFCPRTFRNQSNMLTHRKKMHPDQYQKPAYLRDEV